MIYVTHDQVEAMTLGDRIVVMNRGEVRQVGTPLEVYDRPRDKFVARFVGSPPMNLIEGEMRDTEQRAGGLVSKLRLSGFGSRREFGRGTKRNAWDSSGGYSN